ncbi:MAG: exo-alpha-sialidase, partial [Bryobacterales bacterium]|nr:exo-alpha-sialidase [Bryobacterales bacterium]
SNPEHVFFLLSLNVWGRDWPLLLHSTDAASSIAVTGMELSRPYLPSKGSGLDNVHVYRITFDPRREGTVYGASDKGFCRSEDGGVTWKILNGGLRIPYAYDVFAPAETPGKIFLSTPAGLHASTDSGATWGKPILVLNGLGARPTDLGGLGYLVAYWPGRYFGFINDQEAARIPPGE